MASHKIRIAIIGGGLAGALLMNALTKYPHLDVQLYEAKSELQERGASVGLSVNAQRALRLLGMEDITRKASAVKVGCLQLLVVCANTSPLDSIYSPTLWNPMMPNCSQVCTSQPAVLLEI